MAQSHRSLAGRPTGTRGLAVLGLALALTAGYGCGGDSPVEPITSPGVYEREFQVDGRTRTYTLQVPAGWDGESPLPVLVGFHGVPRLYGLQRLTDLDERADDAGVALVLPDADARYGDWDLGCEFCTSASRHGVDDLAMIRRLLDRVGDELPVAAGRIYLTGFSQGGLLALRAACSIGGRFAGVAPVASLLLARHRDDCRAAEPMAALFIHGTEDREFPWQGRVGDLSTSLGAEETLAAWAIRNGCEEDPAVEALPDTAADGTAIQRRDYAGCAPGGALRFYVVVGGGHTWPGSPYPFSDVVTREVSASRLILDFVHTGQP